MKKTPAESIPPGSFFARIAVTALNHAASRPHPVGLSADCDRSSATLARSLSDSS